MAKKTATKKKVEKSFEATLWDSANSLRGTVEPLVPSKYIEFATRDDAEDYGEKMTALQAELRSLFAEEADARKEVENVFRYLGYEL